MTLTRLLAAAIVTLGMCAPVRAQVEAPADQVVLHRLGGAPEIDGDLSDDAWLGAGTAKDWTIPLTTQAAPKYCRAMVGFDDAGIYVGALFGEPNPETLQTDAPDGGSGVWKDDCIEVWVRTTDNRQDFDQFIVNAAGARQRVQGRVGTHDTPQPDFPAGAQVGDAEWSVELFIAYEEIGLEGTPEPGTMIQLKFGREDPSGNETTLMHWPPRAPYGASEGYGRAY
ncbi:MAG: hypothetical protein GF393_08135, partial [Armatimonadia bacterium]|nr:hypothetical protein [Armatimonadia bacterium]